MCRGGTMAVMIPADQFAIFQGLCQGEVKR